MNPEIHCGEDDELLQTQYFQHSWDYPRQRKAAKSRPPPINIAPKEQSRLQNPSASATKSHGGMGPLVKSRLPPRSRNGCWTCRVKLLFCNIPQKSLEETDEPGRLERSNVMRSIHDAGYVPEISAFKRQRLYSEYFCQVVTRLVLQQCLRLQHECDYSPRLSFRDDTFRIRERMQEVCTQGSGVWDNDDTLDSKNEDVPSETVREARALPRFSLLTSDEERELKALLNKPGKYNVICNQDSFRNSSDIDDEDYTSGIKMESRSDDGILWDPTFYETEDSVDNDDGSSDGSEIVIVRRFEDPTPRRVSVANSREKQSISPTPSGDSYSISSADEISTRNLVSNWDPKYLLQYQKYISLHLRQIPNVFTGIWVNPRTLSEAPDVFELESKRFPPLYHAMMALSAFSSIQDEAYNIHSLQHYQYALPKINSLQHYPTALPRECHINSTADLGADGLFFTHLLLLIFEITAAEHWRECLWQNHLDQLVQIITTKAELEGKDRYPSIIWFLVVVDTYAALATGGKGELVETLEECHLVPDAPLLIPYTLTRGRGGISELERNLLIAGTRAHQKVVLLAAKLAKLSRGFQYEDEHSGLILDHQEIYDRQEQIQGILAEMKNLLRDNIFDVMVSSDYQDSSSSRMHGIYYQTNALVLACIIFGHTSMYPHQASYITTRDKQEVENAIGGILDQAKGIPFHEHAPRHERPFELSFMLFSLFLAGVMTSSTDEKDWILNYLTDREKDCLGRNVRSVRNLLQGIHLQQSGSRTSEMMGFLTEIDSKAENALAEVDWKAFMKTKEYQVVCFTL